MHICWHGHEIWWNSLSTDKSWQSWPSCLPITFTIQILCQVRIIRFACSCHTHHFFFFFCAKVFIMLKCLHFYISYLCAKFRHTALNDTNIASTSEVCTVFSLLLWLDSGSGSMLVLQFTVSLWLCPWCCCWWLKWETLIDRQMHVFILYCVGRENHFPSEQKVPAVTF